MDFPKWAKLGICGMVLIYVGNVAINRAVEELDKDIAERKLRAEVWTDAVRSPAPVPVPTEYESRKRRRGRLRQEPADDTDKDSGNADGESNE